MCTGFVYKGKDRICGFNMDLPDGVLDWKLMMDQECFYVGVHPSFQAELLPAGIEEIPDKYLPCAGKYLRIHGVNRHGCFGTQLNALGFTLLNVILAISVSISSEGSGKSQAKALNRSLWRWFRQK